jgi:hypothetical protein
MIAFLEYVGRWVKSPDLTPERITNAHRLLEACTSLENEMVAAGVEFPISPSTKSGVSGQTYGGFRPQSCPIGAPKSAHKEGLAVDRYDPKGDIDKWLLNNPSALERHGIYIEHPSATVGWSHWSIKAPGSGRRIFYP